MSKVKIKRTLSANAINFGPGIGFHVRKLQEHGYILDAIEINTNNWVEVKNKSGRVLKYHTRTEPSVKCPKEMVCIMTEYYDNSGALKTQQTTCRNEKYSDPDKRMYQEEKIKEPKEPEGNLSFFWGTNSSYPI
jgi:hypothetical protein